jgi:hypothetical protein
VTAVHVGDSVAVRGNLDTDSFLQADTVLTGSSSRVARTIESIHDDQAGRLLALEDTERTQLVEFLVDGTARFSNRRQSVEDKPGYLTARQVRKMRGVPDMMIQFVHHLAEKFRAAGYPDVEIRARARASLNGRRQQLLVDPDVDLASQPRSLAPATWILPLTEPLRREADLPSRK